MKKRNNSFNIFIIKTLKERIASKNTKIMNENVRNVFKSQKERKHKIIDIP